MTTTALRWAVRCWGLALLAGLLSWAAPARAASIGLCDQARALSASEQDVLIRMAALVKDRLDASGQRVALVARSGTDLRRVGARYSHAAISLLASDNGPWSARQLYYACDEGYPRLFDQGLAGFLLGSDDTRVGYLSIVLLPQPWADRLEQAALDRRHALQLLAARYSANAYAWSLAYQNCNQWVAELLASAWASPADLTSTPPSTDETPRARAQAWLAAQGYEPSTLVLPFGPLVALAYVMPWVHNLDHPAEDLALGRYRTSMPASLEAFVRRLVPEARRIEICHRDRQVVIHEGWTPVADGCEPAEGEEVVWLD